MKAEDIWPTNVRTLNHQFDVIVASLDKVSNQLIEKGILKTEASALEVPKIVAQHLRGDQYYMDDTPENRKVLAWFVTKAKQMYSLEDKINTHQLIGRGKRMKSTN